MSTCHEIDGTALDSVEIRAQTPKSVKCSELD